MLSSARSGFETEPCWVRRHGASVAFLLTSGKRPFWRYPELWKCMWDLSAFSAHTHSHVCMQKTGKIFQKAARKKSFSHFTATSLGVEWDNRSTGGDSVFNPGACPAYEGSRVSSCTFISAGVLICTVIVTVPPLWVFIGLNWNWTVWRRPFRLRGMFSAHTKQLSPAEFGLNQGLACISSFRKRSGKGC